LAMEIFLIYLDCPSAEKDSLPEAADKPKHISR
jgi:hypothetical protein